AKGRRDPDQRQADQCGRIAAPDRGKEYDAEPFGLEPARAVVRLLDREVSVERVARKLREVDLGDVDRRAHAAVAAVDDRRGGVEHDGAAARCLELLERGAVAPGLAQDAAVERRDLVGADHDRVGSPRDGSGLADGEPDGGSLGRFPGRDRLVDVRRTGFERQVEAREQLGAVLRGRSEYQAAHASRGRAGSITLTYGFDSINPHLYDTPIMPASLFSWYGARELTGLGERQSVLRGEIELKRFNRLADLLESDAGVVTAALRFRKDSGGWLIVELE